MGWEARNRSWEISEQDYSLRNVFLPCQRRKPQGCSRGPPRVATSRKDLRKSEILSASTNFKSKAV
eukprot:78032-Amorphochlora_amoeboformis.AAC.2